MTERPNVPVLKTGVVRATVGSNPPLSAIFLESKMPIYSYSCSNCSAVFEKIMSVRERDSHYLRCPECGHGEVNRLVSKSSFSLKGKGWYKDGYQKGSANEAD